MVGGAKEKKVFGNIPILLFAMTCLVISHTLFMVSITLILVNILKQAIKTNDILRERNNELPI